MITFSQRTAFMFSQPVRSRIIFHPLGFVFHIQAVPGLAITKILAEVQTSTHTIGSVMFDKYAQFGSVPGSSVIRSVVQMSATSASRRASVISFCCLSRA
jgi:hypothetical protein